MVDATGKPPSGTMEGTAVDYGSMELCFEVDRLLTGSIDINWKGIASLVFEIA